MEKVKRSLVLLLIVSSITLPMVKSDLRDILKTCDDLPCQLTEEESNQINQTDLNAKMYKYMTAGVPQIFWDSIRSPEFSSAHLSKECRTHLIQVSDGLWSLDEWAFRFVDAAGKTPSAVLRSTVTSLGDYDECLRIDRGSYEGKYCLVDMFPMAKWREEPGKFALSKTSLFKEFSFANSICVPSSCSTPEIKSYLSSLLQPYLLKVNGTINCDTKTSVSILTKLMSFNIHQIVSAMFIVSVVSVVLICSLVQFYNRIVILPEWRIPQSELLKSLSVMESTRKVFYSREWSYETYVFHAAKWFVITSGTMAHIIGCVEMPISYYMMDRHEILNDLFSSPEMQPLLNDAGLVSVTLLSGIASFAILYPMAKSKKLPYLAAIFDRFARFLPAMVSLTALEFLWHMVGSGPFFTRVAEFNNNRCRKNWWLNFLFMNNYFIRAIDICGGHSFYSSVDLQLFILGLICVFIFTKSNRAGLAFCILMIFLGNYKTYVYAVKYETTGSMFISDPIARKISEYFDYIHMATSTYVPSYFMGMIVGYCIHKGYKPPLNTWKDHAPWLWSMFFFMSSNDLIKMFYNSFKIIPQSWSFLVILWNRNAQTLGVIVIVVYLLNLGPENKNNKNNKSTDHNNNRLQEDDNSSTAEPPKEEYSFFKALSKLSFALYMSNYLYIRTEFFTRRSLFPNHYFLILKRALSSLIFIYIVAFVFHIFFVAPFDALRKHYFEKKKRSSPQQESQKID